MLERIFQEPKFRVCCLGAIKLVEAGSGTDMTPASRKTRALLGYLCVVGKPVGRERLASLLWGDRGDEQARASLRQAIYELRSLLGGNHLVKAERDTVAAGDEVGTDLAEITVAAESGNLEQLARALAVWRGDVFEDLSSIDPSFDAWLQAERLRVQESLIGAATEAAKSGMARGEIDAARKVVNLLQQHDGTNEVVLRLGLRLDQLAGDSGALHRRYERFREFLRSDLDAAPAMETQLLFDELITKSSAPELVASPATGNAAEIAREHVEQGTGNGPVAPAPPPPRPSHRWLKPGAILFALAALCVLAWTFRNVWYKSAPRTEALLAVMPFQDLDSDPVSRSVSDGVGEEIAAALQQTTKIRIASAPTGLRLPNANAPAATHVLSGSVERVGNRIHVVAQVMEMADDRIVWGHAYDEAMSQTPALRHDFAMQIAGALRKFLTSGSFNRAPADSAAYDHYMNGRSLMRQNNPGAAAAELETSLRLAPDFANGWASLAAARLSLASNMFARHRNANAVSMARAARPAAERALALDPDNGEALGVLAMLIPATRLVDIDRQFQRALRSEPDNSQVLDWHAEFLMYVGRNHEALNELKRAYILNREIPSVATDLVLASLKTSRMDEARDITDLVDDGRDNRLHAAFYFLRVKYFLYKRDWFGLATYLNTVPNRFSPPVAAFFHLCRETAIAFATRETDRFGQLRARWRSESPVDMDDTTEFLSALGDDSGALAVVQSAVKSLRNDAFLTDPQWEALFAPDLVPLRSDPRVPALLAQWGLADYWRATNHAPDYMR